MSYSTKVKNELCDLEVSRSCCLISEICGIIKLSGQYQHENDALKAILVSTENKKIAERFSWGFNKFYGINVNVIRKNKSRGGKELYDIVLPTDCLTDDILSDLDAIIPEYYRYSGSKSGKCCIRSFLRGAFLAAGSVSNPKKTYHLEISARDENTAGILCAFLSDFEMNPKIVLRKGSYVVYIKDAEFISDFLVIIGAHKSLMEYENIRIMKEMRNNINRAVNCETANIQKTLDASFKQIESIKFICEKKSLGLLPDNLKELALLRLDHPDLSLTEIGALLNPPLSKSGVSHRMKRIMDIAEDLKNH